MIRCRIEFIPVHFPTPTKVIIEHEKLNITVFQETDIVDELEFNLPTQGSIQETLDKYYELLQNDWTVGVEESIWEPLQVTKIEFDW